MKLDILAFGAHPDDVELGCGGTLYQQIQIGKKVGIIDLTRGELGTRGTPEIRDEEAKNAQQILGVHIRENLILEDGFFQNNKETQIIIIQAIRKYQPEIVFCNATIDRHPDHGKAATLVQDACFLSGLKKINTIENQVSQSCWRPKQVYHYIQDKFITPSFVVDITNEFEIKMKSIQAHKSQFYNQELNDSDTYISSPEFWNNIETRAQEFGRSCGFLYAEGFTTNKMIGIKNFSSLL